MQNKLLILLIVLCMAGMFAWWWNATEPYEEYVSLGWSEEAQRNPYLAAQKFLEGKIDSVESGNQLSLLDTLTDNSVLVIINANQVLNERRAAEVVEWMKSGGQVIVAADFYDEDDPDVLLSQFEVTKDPLDDGFEGFSDDAWGWGENTQSSDEDNVDEDGDHIDQNKADQNEADEDKAVKNKESDNNTAEEFAEKMRKNMERATREREREEAEKDAVKQQLNMAETTRRIENYFIADNLSTLSFYEFDYALTADFSGSGTLSHPALYLEEDEDYSGYQPDYWAGNDNTVSFLQIDVGDGMLNVMADLNIWTSDQIGLFDHALLLAVLTESSDRVVFLYGAQVPGLFELIWKYFSELVMISLLLLVCWIIYFMRRFGPIRVRNYSERRSYHEHIAAMADYRWRHHSADGMLAGLRKDIISRLQRRTSNTLDLTNQKALQEKLIEMTGITPEQANHAMNTALPQDEMKYAILVKLLQKIRNRL